MSKHAFYGLDDKRYPNGYMNKMAIVGHTTATTARLWFRAGQPGAYRVLVYKKPDGEDIIYKSFSHYPYDSGIHADKWVENVPVEVSGRKADYTFIVDLEGLEPGTEYGYALFSFGDPREENDEKIVLGKNRPHSFKTMPKDENGFSFALYSCHMPYVVTNHFFGREETSVCNDRMWRFFRDAVMHERENGLRFVIGGGDQAYCDGVKSIHLWRYLNATIKRKGGEPSYPDYEAMLSWYRSMYRGYWEFPELKEIFSTMPTYMMWDDHELCDGHGSYKHDPGTGDLGEYLDILPNLKDRAYSYEEGMKVIGQMGRAAKRAYLEYQHSHNPDPHDGDGEVWDYSFSHGPADFYMLDGRGHRDFNRARYKIHGEEQFSRFRDWIRSDDRNEYLFVLAAVPVFHLKPAVAQLGDGFFGRIARIQDDLRDSWEHDAHTEERNEFCELLFEAAGRGKKVCILSGDVHLAASYKVSKGDAVIYQLTSSAITYNITRLQARVLKGIALPTEGEVEGTDYRFERLVGPNADSNFSIIRVRPEKGTAEFLLYTENMVKGDIDEEGRSSPPFPMVNYKSRTVLDFK